MIFVRETENENVTCKVPRIGNYSVKIVTVKIFNLLLHGWMTVFMKTESMNIKVTLGSI